MAWGLLFAFLASAATAGATIFQAIGVRRSRHYAHVDPRLLLSAVRSGPYMLGLLLLAISFLLTVIALRTTALFLVQALTAASIAGVAATSAAVFRTRLHWAEWTAVAMTAAGVALLVIVQKPTTAGTLPAVGAWAVLIAAGAIAVIALTANRWLSGAVVPGLLAGLAYGDAAVASRMISQIDGSAVALVRSPATYAIVIAGLIGTLLYATALQRGSVTAVFGLSTVGQTIGPAITGWLLLGDSVHSAGWPIAATGFGAALVGALVLGRHASPHAHVPRTPAAAAPARTRGEAKPIWRRVRLPRARVVRAE